MTWGFEISRKCCLGFVYFAGCFCVTTSWSTGLWSNIWLPCYSPPFRVRALQDSRNILQFLVTSPSVRHASWKHCGRLHRRLQSNESKEWLIEIYGKFLNLRRVKTDNLRNFSPFTRWIILLSTLRYNDVECWLVYYGKQSSPNLTSRPALSSKNLPRVCLDAIDTLNLHVNIDNIYRDDWCWNNVIPLDFCQIKLLCLNSAAEKVAVFSDVITFFEYSFWTKFVWRN